MIDGVATELAIEGGIAEVFDHIENAGPMWCGSGKRWTRASVDFPRPFSSAPTIQLSIAMIDADSSRNLRIELHAEDISETGFTVTAHTWSDTRIGRLQVNWTALGTRLATEGKRWNV